jgi:Pyridine nucleotide-disulphide oxidoreductase
MERCDVAIIGAGPYGLAAAAHLRRISGLDIRLFGEVMSFWERHMPEGMCLRSPWDASHISDPEDGFTLDAYCRRQQRPHLNRAPIAVNDFVSYGRWFHQQVGVSADPRTVARLDRASNGFRLVLEESGEVHAARVVIAAGVQPFAYRPPVFDCLPSELATHTSERHDFSSFRGKQVFVIGGGTSAIETAGFLCEAGARIEVLMRDSAIRWPRQWLHAKPLGWMFYGRGDVGPALISLIVQRPNLFRGLPRSVQTWGGRRAIRPSALPRLKPTLAGVPVHPGRWVLQARPDGERLRLWLNDGTQRVVDHVIFGTGYRVNVARYSFLSSQVLDHVTQVTGYPQLDAGFETTLPGLHFLGAPSAWSFGPLMRFVAGTEFTARSLARHVAASNQRSRVTGAEMATTAAQAIASEAESGAA